MPGVRGGGGAGKGGGEWGGGLPYKEDGDTRRTFYELN